MSDAIAAGDGIDGLATTVVPTSSPTPSPRHPNTVSAIDHVVVATPDTARTYATLEAAGFELRRVRDAGPDLRQGFFLFADVLLEVVGPPAPDDRAPPATPRACGASRSSPTTSTPPPRPSTSARRATRSSPGGASRSSIAPRASGSGSR